ncbi:MAG: hypothetical protein R3C20_25230 [Planctomycetaceae bacterium]
MKSSASNTVYKASAMPLSNTTPASRTIATVIAFLAITLSSTSFAGPPNGFNAADSITQQWNITRTDARLKATSSIIVTGQPGDQFTLLKSPAVLTNFNGEGLRLTKHDIPNEGLSYVISIPLANQAIAKTFTATFEYQLEAINLDDVPVLTGSAAVQQIDLTYDEAGWDIVGSTAVRIEQLEADESSTKAKVLLGPGKGSLALKPRVRDVSSEKTQFFVEASNLFLPGPGVVDGRHRLNIRTSQGQVSELNVLIPQGSPSVRSAVRSVRGSSTPIVAG